MADTAEQPAPGLAGAELFRRGSAAWRRSMRNCSTGAGVERGVVGPAEAERIWDRHLLNCAVIARLIPSKSSVVDLGSGAGLPGIVLAMLLPACQGDIAGAAGPAGGFPGGVRGRAWPGECRGRARPGRGSCWSAGGRCGGSRAVAPLEKLAGLSLGLVRPGGRILAMKGASADAELARARPVLARLGVTDARVVTGG